MWCSCRDGYSVMGERGDDHSGGGGDGKEEEKVHDFHTPR